ncbi:MAG: acyl-ACP desaturase, partial [Acidimicrobiia bacterium]|nr:acyl-ACP desaturase [Acidimicrobiia bacterium]
AWGEWVRRWTAEEGRHAVVIRDYLTVTRAIDPVALEQGRMVQMSTGEVPQPPSAADGMCYVALQELATRISHRNTGTHIKDKVGYNIMRQVAIDENLHFLFYRDIATAGFAYDPSQMMEALERQLIGFAMPGTGIPGFQEHSKLIAAAGIYDLVAHFDKIIEPVVQREWKVEKIEGLDAEAEQARERIMKYINKSRRVADRMRAKREAKAAEGDLVSA